MIRVTAMTQCRNPKPNRPGPLQAMAAAGEAADALPSAAASARAAAAAAAAGLPPAAAVAAAALGAWLNQGPVADAYVQLLCEYEPAAVLPFLQVCRRRRHCMRAGIPARFVTKWQEAAGGASLW